MNMYEPTQSEIDDKVQELLDANIADVDCFINALIECLPHVSLVYKGDIFELNDTVYDFKDAIDRYLTKSLDLEEQARNMLIAEVGTVVRTDVDDYEFIPHDTRY
jgi:hypothetical protein